MAGTENPSFGCGCDSSAGEAMPLSIIVPVCNMTEPDLMAALEQVVNHWPRDTVAETRAVSRAVTWLGSKYGEVR